MGSPGTWAKRGHWQVQCGPGLVPPRDQRPGSGPGPGPGPASPFGPMKMAQDQDQDQRGWAGPMPGPTKILVLFFGGSGRGHLGEVLERSSLAEHPGIRTAIMRIAPVLVAVGLCTCGVALPHAVLPVDRAPDARPRPRSEECLHRFVAVANRDLHMKNKRAEQVQSFLAPKGLCPSRWKLPMVCCSCSSQ